VSRAVTTGSAGPFLVGAMGFAALLMAYRAVATEPAVALAWRTLRASGNSAAPRHESEFWQLRRSAHTGGLDDHPSCVQGTRAFTVQVCAVLGAVHEVPDDRWGRGGVLASEARETQTFPQAAVTCPEHAGGHVA
jgi:hypothetical protein